MSTLIWIGLGIAAVCLLGSKGKTSGQKTAGKPVRIDHPHYISADEYECGNCGRRFNRACTVCPHCGMRFSRAETDENEWNEEFEDEIEMDEWDEEG